MSDNIIFELQSIKRSFKRRNQELNIFDDLSVMGKKGELIALVGPSGAGKSTLLQITGLLEKPNKGDVIIDGVKCSKLSDRQKTYIRLLKIGFVYQYHRLLPEFSAAENVMMPQLINNKPKKEAFMRACELLYKLGLKDRVEHKPGELSGGEQQRVAIARALANKPYLLLADEPTGNLDPKTSDSVYNNLLHLVKDEGLTALIATHNMELASQMDRIIMLKDRKLQEVQKI